MDEFESIDDWIAACKALRPDQLSLSDLVARLNSGTADGIHSLASRCYDQEWCRPRMYSIYLDSHLPPDQRERGKDWDQIGRESAAWRCLFLFDSDNATFGKEWAWGDSGQLQLWIRRDDLARRRFEETQLYCETT